jgi:hypothetical protein
VRAWLALAVLIAVSRLAAAGPIALLASDGRTPLVGAEIVAEKLDGTRIAITVPPEGTVTVREVPLGILKITVVSWKGVPVNYTCRVAPANSTVTVPGIHKLTVSAVGSRGQGLRGASVEIFYGGRSVDKGIADEAGSYTTLLPAASYVVKVNYGGKTAEKQVDLSAPDRVVVQLDVFAEIGGVALSSSEVMGLIALAALIPLILFVIAYEYAQWRRKKILKVVAGPQ